ncbi:MAG: hypothetical protein Q7S80_01890 [bacterium]|nr:hypothetical protein [bacterium]
MLGERPTIEKVVVVRHALDAEGGYLAPEGRNQCQRLVRLMNEIRDDDSRAYSWTIFSSTTPRAVETVMEVSRGLLTWGAPQTSPGLTGARAPFDDTMCLVSQLDPKVRALLFVVHVYNVEPVIRAVCEQVAPGFKVRLPWPENTRFRANNTGGVVIDIKHGATRMIDGSVAGAAS